MVARWPGCRSSSAGALTARAMPEPAAPNAAPSSRMPQTPSRRQRQQCRVRALQQHHAKARIRHHVGQPLARIVRVERQIGAAALSTASSPTPVRVNARPAPRPAHPARRRGSAGDAPGGWRGRRARRSSAPGPRTSPPRPPACAKPAPQTAQAGWWARSAARLSFRAAAGWCRARPAPGSAVRQARARRIGHRRRQQPDQAPAQRLDRRRIEQVA